MKIYVDTSVINGLIATDAPEIQEKTKRFFARVQKHEFDIYISGIVIGEIEATRDSVRQRQLVEILDKYSFHQLEVPDAALGLADEYVLRGIVPLTARSDALHIAIASVHGIEVLVSWNFKHIVRHKTRTLANALNGVQGYGQVDLCTPEEI